MFMRERVEFPLGIYAWRAHQIPVPTLAKMIKNEWSTEYRIHTLHSTHTYEWEKRWHMGTYSSNANGCVKSGDWKRSFLKN